METVGIVAGIVVGLALAVAGVLKLLDGPGWIRQAADMGVGRPVSSVVPFVEIGLGVLVASHLLAPWPAIGAVVLMTAMTILIVTRLLDGSRPPCACFGTRSKRPLGAFHVVRNLVLLAVAVIAAVWG